MTCLLFKKQQLRSSRNRKRIHHYSYITYFYPMLVMCADVANALQKEEEQGNKRDRRREKRKRKKLGDKSFIVVHYHIPQHNIKWMMTNSHSTNPIHNHMRYLQLHSVISQCSWFHNYLGSFLDWLMQAWTLFGCHNTIFLVGSCSTCNICQVFQKNLVLKVEIGRFPVKIQNGSKGSSLMLIRDIWERFAW